MAGISESHVDSVSDRLNVADRLTAYAKSMPDALAVVSASSHSTLAEDIVHRKSGALYSTITFAELDAEAMRIAAGFKSWGVRPGTRLALLVRPGIDFVVLVFALLRAGVVIVLVDPGIGRKNLVRCLADAKPEGFVAIGRAQIARLVYRRRFPLAKWNVTVGRRWFWGGTSLYRLRILGQQYVEDRDVASSPQSLALSDTCADDAAAIIFTSGSTGPPKGVLYTHRMFDTQVAEIQSQYEIDADGVDLACFPLFALFNSAMGVTTVLPKMDFSRPAKADPRTLLAAANDWRVSQAFASPAVWRVVSEHCAKTGERIESLKQVFACGAPVPAEVIRATLACVGDGAKMHTPYGATECLPVATIEAAEVLKETAARTDEGAGVCVGRKFNAGEWRIIRITDEPIDSLDGAEELPQGEIGELIVRGPQVSPAYVTRVESNSLAKISDDGSVWHRVGDVGYFDDQMRFWYCGRKSQRVETTAGPLYTECVEGVFNSHPNVRRSALIGLGNGRYKIPAIVIEHDFGPFLWVTEWDNELYSLAKKFAHTSKVERLIPCDGPLPVDIRHNAKINRERLAARFTKELARSLPQSQVTGS